MVVTDIPIRLHVRLYVFSEATRWLPVVPSFCACGIPFESVSQDATKKHNLPTGGIVSERQQPKSFAIG